MRSLVVAFAIVGVLVGVLYTRHMNVPLRNAYQVAEERLQAERARGHIDTETAELVRVALRLVRERENGQGPEFIHVARGTLRLQGSRVDEPGVPSDCMTLDMRPWLGRELTVLRCP